MRHVVDHDERRNALAEAVFAVIRRDGINAASVRAVAAEAGWTRGVIAHYFKDRDDLLLYAYRLAIRNTCDLVREASKDMSPLEALAFALCRMLPVDDSSAINFQIWLGFMGRVADEPDLGRSVLHEHQDLRALVGELALRWIDSEARSVDVSVDELTEELFVHIDGLGVTAALNPSRYSPTRLQADVQAYLESHLRRATVTGQQGPQHLANQA